MQHNLANDFSERSYLDTLNPEQREAVEITDGPLLVLAGAGTGKTRVLTTRIAHIISTGRAYPNQILAVTFTNKAAREMVERVAKTLGRDVSGMWLGTFHSICAKILRRHAELLGFKNNFTILDADDQIRLLKKIIIENNLDEKKWSAKILMGIIQSFKDKGINPDKAENTYAGNFAEGRSVELYTKYQARLKANNTMDFGDLLMHCLALFTKHADVLSQYHSYFKYILVDEYQDTNVAQYLWLRLLAQGSGNICCVGDDDQSIYSWRGAQVDNILRFEKDFPAAKTVKLERNYRSTSHILSAASTLIANNKGRIGKTLRAEGKDGEKIKSKFLWDGDEEAKFVADEIESHVHSLTREKHKYTEFAVLVRAGFQTRSFEERFLTLSIPYRVIGGLRFYERAEIRDATAYIRVLMQPESDLSFERIINVPKRGIGKSAMEVLYRRARTDGIPLYTATEKMIAENAIAAKARNELKNLTESFAKWRKLLSDTPHAEVVQQMLEGSGYINMWKEEAAREKSLEAGGRLENLSELIRAIAEFETLTDFLDHISLVMENDNTPNSDMVNIMTLHAAKGLEFDTVFLPGWEEGLFPHQRSLDESGQHGLEEERRLAYVGITRARKNLYITHAANRRVYNQWQNSMPSRFLAELPQDNVEQLPNNLNYNRAAPTERPVFSFNTEKALPKVEDENAIKYGSRVFHDKFGYGKVLSINGENLEIDFEHTGKKTLKAGFVKKQR